MKINKRGFTLIELLIAISIIGIIASIAYPSYRSSVQRSHRADAQGALASLANAMSQWYLQEDPTCVPAKVHPNNPSYLCAAVGPADTGVPRIFSTTVPISGGTPTYNLTIEAATISTFTLRATPTGSQVGDGYLELTELGVKRWDKNDNGNIGDEGEASWD